MLLWIPDLQHLLLLSKFQAQSEKEVSLLSQYFPAEKQTFWFKRWLCNQRQGYFRQRQLFTWHPTAEQWHFHSKLYPKDPEFSQETWDSLSTTEVAIKVILIHWFCLPQSVIIDV